MGCDSVCALCPGEQSSPEIVLSNIEHPNAQTLIAVGVADEHGDVADWEYL